MLPYAYRSIRAFSLTRSRILSKWYSSTDIIFRAVRRSFAVRSSRWTMEERNTKGSGSDKYRVLSPGSSALELSYGQSDIQHTERDVNLSPAVRFRKNPLFPTSASHHSWGTDRHRHSTKTTRYLADEKLCSVTCDARLRHDVDRLFDSVITEDSRGLGRGTRAQETSENGTAQGSRGTDTTDSFERRASLISTSAANRTATAASRIPHPASRIPHPVSLLITSPSFSNSRYRSRVRRSRSRSRSQTLGSRLTSDAPVI